MTASASKFDRIVTSVLTVATLVALGLLVERRFNPPRAVDSHSRIERLKNWQTSISAVDVPVADSMGPIKVVVFTDFECPYCARMDSALTHIAAEFPGKISRSIIQYPLDIHKYANSAASAFECARRQGRGLEMHTELFLGQKRFGQATWSDFAKKSGVPDSAAFAQCQTQDAAAADISAGIAFAAKHGVTGTPTVVVNGWLFDPSMPALIERAISNVIKGKSPESES